MSSTDKELVEAIDSRLLSKDTDSGKWPAIIWVQRSEDQGAFAVIIDLDHFNQLLDVERKLGEQRRFTNKKAQDLFLNHDHIWPGSDEEEQDAEL